MNDSNGPGRLRSFLEAVDAGEIKDIRRHLSLLEPRDDDRIRESCLQAIHTLIEQHDLSDAVDDILQSQLFKEKKARLMLKYEIPHFINTAAGVCKSLHQLREFISMLTAIKPKLADNGEVMDLQDSDGLSALHLAVMEGDVKATENLLELGSDCQQTTLDGNTSLSLAIAMDHIDLVSLILPHSNVNTSDMDGDTPLMYASWRRRAGLVLQLIEAGADVNAESAHGTTALWNAVYRSCPETAMVLLQYNAKMDVCCEGTRLFRTREDDETAANFQRAEKIYQGHKRSLLWVAADRVHHTDDYDKSMHILLTLLEAGYDVTKEKWLDNVEGNVPKKFPQGFVENEALKNVLYFFHSRPLSLRDMCRGVLRSMFADTRGQFFSDWLSSMNVGGAVIDFLSLKYTLPAQSAKSSSFQDTVFTMTD